MQDSMRLEVVWWMCSWCKAKESTSKFVDAVELVSRGQHADGIKVVFERMEEVVRKAISILVWWHREQCKIDGKIDQS